MNELYVINIYLIIEYRTKLYKIHTQDITCIYIVKCYIHIIDKNYNTNEDCRKDENI